jgi:hypothetical protein
MINESISANSISIRPTIKVEDVDIHDRTIGNLAMFNFDNQIELNLGIQELNDFESTYL